MIKRLICILLLLSSCASQQNMFEQMQKVDGYTGFHKSAWKTYKNYKCFYEAQEKEEYFAVDVEGNPVIVISCCNFWSCYAIVIKN